MKVPASILIAIVVSACTTTAHQPFIINDLDPSNSVTIQDTHPLDENKSEAFSYLVSSERYDLFRLGFVAQNPSALRLLQQRANEHFGSQKSVTIKIHHFAAYQNLQKSLRTSALNSTLTVMRVPYTINQPDGNQFSNTISIINPEWFEKTSGDNEWQRGIPTPEETPTNGACLIIWLDVEINGKRLFLRSVSPSAKAEEIKKSYALALESTYSYLLKQFQP